MLSFWVARWTPVSVSEEHTAVTFALSARTEVTPLLAFSVHPDACSKGGSVLRSSPNALQDHTFRIFGPSSPTSVVTVSYEPHEGWRKILISIGVRIIGGKMLWSEVSENDYVAENWSARMNQVHQYRTSQSSATAVVRMRLATVRFLEYMWVRAVGPSTRTTLGTHKYNRNLGEWSQLQTWEHSYA